MGSEPFDDPKSVSSGEEFAHLVDAVEDYAIFLLSPEGIIRSWNRGAQRIMGYQQEEVRGRHFSIFYGPEALAEKKPQRELEIALAEGRVEDEGWRIRKDGTRFWADTIITPLREEDGTVRGFAKVTRDLTDRREAEEKLRESTEVFQLLVSSVRDYAIFMLDPDGRIATWNVGAERIKGYAPPEIIGRHFSTFYTEEDLRSGKPERILMKARIEGSVEDEGWRVRKDGSRFWAMVVITAVYDSKGSLRGFAKVTRDVTERKKAEEIQIALLEQREARLQAEIERARAQASYEEAREANQAKDEFLMTLSHELRTPMTAILGWARLLPSLPPGDPQFRQAVASIGASADLQAQLIDDILDVSRIVSGKMRLNTEPVDLAPLIANAVDSVRSSAEAKEITLNTALPPDLGTILADGTRLQQVIWNLVANAVKFTPRGGSVRLTAERTASEIRIEVADTGEGIEAEFLPHVFEAFRQAEMSRTRVHGGLGLGLSIVHYIVEAHGGTVTAQSAGPGQGATFTVRLPVREESFSTQPRAEGPGPGGIRDLLRGVKIMVVDDDRNARRMIEVALRTSGAAVTALDSASAALEMVRLQRPHVIVTDVAMPGMDGYAFTRALREEGLGEDVKVVALSAYPAGGPEQSVFNAYLTKPIDPFHLVAEIDRIINGRKG